MRLLQNKLIKIKIFLKNVSLFSFSNVIYSERVFISERGTKMSRKDFIISNILKYSGFLFLGFLYTYLKMDYRLALVLILPCIILVILFQYNKIVRSSNIPNWLKYVGVFLLFPIFYVQNINVFLYLLCLVVIIFGAEYYFTFLDLNFEGKEKMTSR